MTFSNQNLDLHALPPSHEQQRKQISPHPVTNSFLYLVLKDLTQFACLSLQEELMNNTELVQSYRQQINNTINQFNLQLFWNMYNRCKNIVSHSHTHTWLTSTHTPCLNIDDVSSPSVGGTWRWIAVGRCSTPRLWSEFHDTTSSNTLPLW